MRLALLLVPIVVIVAAIAVAILEPFIHPRRSQAREQ